ncbi:tyrosine-protein phosphatase [Taibaiella lutea]|nr:CpsB/CapC family capsule biosynthesis tyrosine phosphatase [Taibaiella lutea]
MHSHLIPGIDDGTADMEQSLSLLQKLQEAGFSKIVTTPHISLDYFPNAESTILTGLENLKDAVRENSINLEVHAAAEYMIDESLMKKLASNEQLLTLDGEHVLFEMGFVQEDRNLMQVIFELQTRGYKPVLAHPERYNFYIDASIDTLQKLKDAGCLFQLNTIALSGYYGKHIKLFAEKILKEGLYEFAGTDIHHERHLGALLSIYQPSVIQTLKAYPFLNKNI